MKLTIFLSSLFMIECARAKSSRGFYLKKCAFASSSDIPIRRLTSSRDIGTKTRSTNGRAFIRLKGAVNVVSEAFATTIITAVDESLILSDSTLWALRAFSAIGSYVGFVSYFDRPRGTLNVQEGVQVEIKESMVPGAGLGLFAKTNLQRGTLLGTYPGVVIPLQQNLDKLRQYPACEGYTWRFSDNKSVIDPTNSVGVLDPVCYGGNPSLPGSVFLLKHVIGWTVPTTLCRINEPPKGKDVNVIITEDRTNRRVVFELERDVYVGEEFYIDYGMSYDRSMYNTGSPNDSL